MPVLSVSLFEFISVRLGSDVANELNCALMVHMHENISVNHFIAVSDMTVGGQLCCGT